MQFGGDYNIYAHQNMGVSKQDMTSIHRYVKQV